MVNLSREYCAYFGQATEVWKRHVIGEVVVAIDEFRDSVCQTVQDADNSVANASTGGGQDGNNQEEMFSSVLVNAQQQAEQRIVNALSQTLNQPPPVLHSPVVSNIANQAAHVNPPGESAISQVGVISVQNDADNDSLDNEDIASADEIGDVDAEDDADGDLEDDETVDNMDVEENDHSDVQESDTEDSMIDEENAGEESDNYEDQVNMSGVEDNDEDSEEDDYLMSNEDSSDDTTDDDEEQPAGPSTSTCRRTNRQVSKRQSVPNRRSKQPNKVKKPESFITKKLKCTVPGCKKVVKSTGELNGHLLSVHKLKKFRCLVRRCYGKMSTSFATRAQFSDHLDLVHGSSSRLTCHCLEKFKNYNVLYTHYWTKHQLGTFVCSKNGCSFKPTSTRGQVVSHARTHGETNYECPVDGCDWSFKQKCNLEQHLVTHSGQRPYPCPECDKSFNQKGTLTRHRQIHRNVKCYKCTWQECTYSATNSSNVIAHIRTVHFKLPVTKKQQAEEGIEDDRDAFDYLTKD